MGLLTGQNTIYTIKQITLGILIGIFLSFVYIKTYSIFACIILHMLWDFTVFCTNYMSGVKYKYGGYNYFPDFQVIIVFLLFFESIILLLSMKSFFKENL